MTDDFKGEAAGDDRSCQYVSTRTRGEMERVVKALNAMKVPEDYRTWYITRELFNKMFDKRQRRGIYRKNKVNPRAMRVIHRQLYDPKDSPLTPS